MKILIVSPYFAPSSLVGAQRMTSLARYLADHGHEVHVVSLTADTMERTTLGRFFLIFDFLTNSLM